MCFAIAARFRWSNRKGCCKQAANGGSSRGATPSSFLGRCGRGRKNGGIARGGQKSGDGGIGSGRLPGNSLLFWCEPLLDDCEAWSRDPCSPTSHNLIIRRNR